MNILSRKKNDGNIDFASSEDPLEDDNRRKKMVPLKNAIENGPYSYRNL